MVAPLDDDQGVARMVLRRDVPRGLRAAVPASHAQAPALADGEEGEAPVLADTDPGIGLDRPRRRVDEAGEEGREPAFADEAESGAVGLVVQGQSRAPGQRADRALAQRPEREDRPLDPRSVERVQKVALVLGGVGALEQPRAVDGVLDPGVVAGRDALGAEPARVLDERAELHLPVAQHVGIRGQAVFEAVDEAHEDVVPVGVGAVHGVQGDAEPVAYAPGVGEVFGRGAVSGVVVFLPVLHEHRLHRNAGLGQAQQRHGGVHAAGQRDHRRRGGARGRIGGEGGRGVHRSTGPDESRGGF